MTIRAQFPDEQSAAGAFERQDDAFRNWVQSASAAEFPLEAHRYHLYVSLACPWAHRTILLRTLLNLTESIGMTIVDPIRDDAGWAFRRSGGGEVDPLNGFSYLAQAYTKRDPNYAGRVTVPVLWDSVRMTIVSNSDDDIMRMLETVFLPLADRPVDLYPAEMAGAIDDLNTRIYENVNNGVYAAGFATSQETYETAVYALFGMLDELEARLTTTRYLFGTRPLESDWRLFVTLIRFDAVYFGHFKCNVRRIVDYPQLFGYMCDLYQIPGVAETVNFDHIKRHYYYTHDDINPTRIVPVGPLQNLLVPHGREHLGA